MIVAAAMVILSVVGVITVFHEPLAALLFPGSAIPTEAGAAAVSAPAR
jgi:hypothetical protein